MEPTYALFLSIEEEIRDCLKTLVTSTPDLNVKSLRRSPTAKIILLVYKTAVFEIDDRETHETLLQMILELYLTIRGYSYASAWMEKFK